MSRVGLDQRGNKGQSERRAEQPQSKGRRRMGTRRREQQGGAARGCRRQQRAASLIVSAHDTRAFPNKSPVTSTFNHRLRTRSLRSLRSLLPHTLPLATSPLLLLHSSRYDGCRARCATPDRRTLVRCGRRRAPHWPLASLSFLCLSLLPPRAFSAALRGSKAAELCRSDGRGWGGRGERGQRPQEAGEREGLKKN